MFVRLFAIYWTNRDVNHLRHAMASAFLLAVGTGCNVHAQTLDCVPPLADAPPESKGWQKHRRQTERDVDHACRGPGGDGQRVDTYIEQGCVLGKDDLRSEVAKETDIDHGARYQDAHERGHEEHGNGPCGFYGARASDARRQPKLVWDVAPRSAMEIAARGGRRCAGVVLHWVVEDERVT